MADDTHAITLPEFTPALVGFRAEEFLALTETLLAFPIEQDRAALDAAPFRLARPEPRPEPPLPALPPRWYPRPAADVLEAARAWLTPPPRPAIFEGRIHELTRVLRPLLSGHPVQVRGEAGVGKTTLLAVIATHERTRQRFRRIWWIDQPDRIDQTLALAFDLPHVLADPDPVRRRERLAKQLDDHTLLIVDNLALDNPLLEQLSVLTQHILAGVETLPVIPDPDNPFPEDPEGVVTLRGLDDTAAADALARHAGIEDIRRIRGELLSLVTALGHHPYALMLAGALIRRDGLSLDELQDLIALEAESESASHDDPIADALADDGETDRSAGTDAADALPINPSLNRALDVSLAALPRDYRRLFDAFGAFPPDGAPFDGLHAVSRIGDLLATRRGLLMLQEYGFIGRDHRDPDHYVMHPVAHLRAAASDGDHPAQSKTAKKVRDWALRYARAHRDDALALYRAEPALLHAYQDVLDHGPQYVGEPLREALIPYLREYVPGLLGEGEAEAVDLSGPRAEGTNLTRYGLELTGEGAYFAAEEALIRALEIREEHDSPHAIAETLVALGRLYDMTARYQEAAEKLIKAAELVYSLGADASLSVVRRGLARVYRHLGRLNDALGVLDDAPEAHFERAMVLRAQGNYPAAVHEMSLAEEDAPYTRAETYLLAEKYAEALEAIAGQDDPESNHLRAQVYHLQGHVDEAIRGYRATLDCCPEDDPARAKTLRGLGAALASNRQYDEAHEVLTAALAFYRAEHTPDPLRLGRTLRLLAAIHLAAGDTAQAITTARDALVQLKKIPAPDDSADAYRTLGRALWRSEDYAGALEAFEGEAEFAQSMAERDDARIGIALHHVADGYRATGSPDRAIANYRLALTHKKPVADPTGYLITQLALHQALIEAARLSAALDVSQEIIDHLTHQGRFDLVQYGYTQALRARTQQAMQRPIRASQSLTEWTQVLAARADEAASDPRPALRVLVLGLATRSLLADDRPALALDVAERGQATAAEHFPNTPAAWAACRDLGETYMALDRAEEAIITLEPLLADTVRDHPGQAATCALAHAITGRAYHRIGDAASALNHLRVALDHEPDDHLKGLIHETIAAIGLETGQPSEAVESLEAALPLLNRAERPDVSARVLTTLAHTLGGLNRYAEAINVYEDALAALRDVEEVGPTHTADVLRSLGRTHEAQGQLAEAAHAYRRALNLLERGDAPRQALDILRLLARVSAALGDYSAVQLYEQARDETEKWGNAQELGEVLRELADVHRDAGRFPLAVQNYQAALSHQPPELFSRDRAHTLRSLGRAWSMMEHYDEARAAWTEALDLSRDLPDESPLEIGLTHHAIAEAHRSQGHYEAAEESYHEALRYLPAGTVSSAAAWRALGQALQADGRPTDAIEALRKALDTEKVQPQQANARIIQTLYLLAEAYEDCSDLEAAIARYHEALVYMDRRLQPVSYADTLRILAGLYVEAENYPEAHIALQGALEVESQHVPRSDERISTTLQAIADAYRTAGDLEQAAEYYQKVTVYANLARRASEDLRETLDELERRRGTLQAAQQSLALLDRNPDADLKDKVLIYALIAHSYAGLNQSQESTDTIRELLDMLAAQGENLRPDDAQGDYRALAWLAAARQAEQENDPSGARTACESALQAAANPNLRWVIEQVAHLLA